jgi:hypothetical protein
MYSVPDYEIVPLVEESVVVMPCPPPGAAGA